MLVYVLFYLGQLSHFPSCCGAGVTNLNEPPSSFLLPPRYCGLGAGSIQLRAIVNKKQCEMRGLFIVAGHLLLNRRCTRLPGCIRLRNDLYCVGWGVKLYSLTQPIGCRLSSHTRACSLPAKQLHAQHWSSPPLSSLCFGFYRLLLIYRPKGMEGWVGLVGWPLADTLLTKWSHVYHRSVVDQGKFASQRPTF